jgi:hypothetical protein
MISISKIIMTGTYDGWNTIFDLKAKAERATVTAGFSSVEWSGILRASPNSEKMRRCISVHLQSPRRIQKRYLVLTQRTSEAVLEMLLPIPVLTGICISCHLQAGCHLFFAISSAAFMWLSIAVE